MRSKTWSESTGHAPRSGHRRAAEGVIRLFFRGLAKRYEVARQRRDLAGLSDHSLRDIGLSRGDVQMELQNPFWRM
jgi:uncharacterized protein YjiS (DUF1127 family)